MANAIRALSLFPTHRLARLGRGRGKKWSRLVKRVARFPTTHPEHMAYSLLLTRLADSIESDEHGLCIMPTCARCAQDILEITGIDAVTLMAEYDAALDEVNSYLASVEAEQLTAEAVA